MELFLSQAAVDAIRAEGQSATEEHAISLIRDLISDVDANRRLMVDVPNEDGARAMTATLFLLRALEIIRESLDTSGKTLQTLGLRSAFELAVVGRFFIDSPDGAEEFRRRFHDDMKAEAGLARDLDYVTAAAPSFLQHVVDSPQKRPRSLAAIAEALDHLDERESAARYSAMYTWRLTHKFVSQSGSHANTVSIKRFTTGEGGVLGVRLDPPAIFEEPALLLVTCFVSELAHAVYRVHNLSSEHLPTAFERPRPPSD